jgi:hypothetical protein
MQKLKTNEDVGDKEFGLFLSKSPFVAQMIAKVTSIEVVHNEIEMLPILKCVGHIY